jgi:hypothetical protein
MSRASAEFEGPFDETGRLLASGDGIGTTRTGPGLVSISALARPLSQTFSLRTRTMASVMGTFLSYDQLGTAQDELRTCWGGLPSANHPPATLGMSASRHRASEPSRSGHADRRSPSIRRRESASRLVGCSRRRRRRPAGGAGNSLRSWPSSKSRPQSAAHPTGLAGSRESRRWPGRRL